MPRKQKPVVVTVPITHAMEMFHRGLAKISTGEVKLTAAGRKALGKSANGARIYIRGMEPGREIVSGKSLQAGRRGA